MKTQKNKGRKMKWNEINKYKKEERNKERNKKGKQEGRKAEREK